MAYTIIEDCSPYYIRFTCPGMDDVISKCLEHIDSMKFTEEFTHHRYSLDNSIDILNSVPFTKNVQLNYARVSLFVTQPGCYYSVHKDGMNHRYSINYTVKILDDKCVTSWYSDEDLKDYAIDPERLFYSRDCIGFDKSKHTPIKTMTAVQGEVVLFNTEIFHDFDNSLSTNERMVLTLRGFDPSEVYFNDVKENLFGR